MTSQGRKHRSNPSWAERAFALYTATRLRADGGAARDAAVRASQSCRVAPAGLPALQAEDVSGTVGGVSTTRALATEAHEICREIGAFYKKKITTC